MRESAQLLQATLSLAVEKAVARGNLTTLEIVGALEVVKQEVLIVGMDIVCENDDEGSENENMHGDS